jgi:hypothetical protein
MKGQQTTRKSYKKIFKKNQKKSVKMLAFFLGI